MMAIRKNSREGMSIKDKAEIAMVGIALFLMALAFPYILHILGFFS